MAFRRVTVRGKVPGDIFQFGMVFEHDGFIQELADDFVAAFAAAYDAPLRADFNTGVTFDDVLVSELQVGSGTVVDTASAVIGLAGTAVVNMMPPQCSLCVTILPVSGTTKGRFYLPPMNTGVQTATGRCSTVKVTAHADAWHELLTSLAGETSPARLGIWRTGPDTYLGSKGISIGDVFDTQRRRRNKLIEVRQQRLVL